MKRHWVCTVVISLAVRAAATVAAQQLATPVTGQVLVASDRAELAVTVQSAAMITDTGVRNQ